MGCHLGSEDHKGGDSTYSVFGCSATAQQKPLLAELGITHVLNAADGPQHIDTGPQFYSDVGFKYHGVPAADRRDFDLAPFFGPAADFIHEALSQRGTNTRRRHATCRHGNVVAVVFIIICTNKTQVQQTDKVRVTDRSVIQQRPAPTGS